MTRVLTTTNERCFCYYNPVLGRFLSADPLYAEEIDERGINTQEINLYAYVGNNPVNMFDPNGQFKITAFYGPSSNVGGLLVGASGMTGRYHEVEVTWNSIKVTSGNMGTYGGGFTLGGSASGGGTAGIMFGGKESLTGTCHEFGGSASLVGGVAGGGGDFLISGDLNKSFFSGDFTFGFSVTGSVGFGAEAHLNTMEGWIEIDEPSTGFEWFDNWLGSDLDDDWGEDDFGDADSGGGDLGDDGGEDWE